ncbi:MAG: GerW family sporulation protein [Oscillospiraceae bacterium]|jgi:sporulation protein YtfJ|nr:GerW family sporulation protein [Oscillospiraceae bacterium]
MANAADLVEMMNASMGRIKDMTDVNTVVGNPIFTPDGNTVIPVSKCSFGFGVGGSEFGKDSKNFGGGSGAGVTVSPIGFLVISGHSVSLLPVNPTEGSTLDKAIDMIPGLIDRVQAFIEKRKKEKKSAPPEQEN